MATTTRRLASRTDRYRSLRNFYLADVRRRASREDDVGLWWRVGSHGPLYRAAWVHGTGELYVTRLGLEHGRGEVTVLGRARDRRELERVLHGWQDACYQPDSMTWLRHRAARLAPTETPAPSLARGSVSHGHRPQSGRVSRPRRGVAPSPSTGIAAR
jgi:hypothetical protein